MKQKLKNSSNYHSRFYKDIDELQIKEEIKKEGFEPFLFSHGPRYRYEPHQHSTEKLLVFLEGSMWVRAGDKEYNCKAGDKLLISGNVEHEATTGPEGCTFFWSER